MRMNKLFAKWLKEEFEKNKGNLLPPKLDDRLALLFLRNYLLGEEWYVVTPLSHEQVNTELVHTILYKFSKKYRREYEKIIKSKGE